MPSYTKVAELPGQSADALYDRVANDIDRLLEKSSIGKFELDRDPGAKVVSFKSKMFSAKLVCTEGKLALDGKLSLMAVPFRSKIDEMIDKWIARTFEQ